MICKLESRSILMFNLIAHFNKISVLLLLKSGSKRERSKIIVRPAAMVTDKQSNYAVFLKHIDLNHSQDSSRQKRKLELFPPLFWRKLIIPELEIVLLLSCHSKVFVFKNTSTVP